MPGDGRAWPTCAWVDPGTLRRQGTNRPNHRHRWPIGVVGAHTLGRVCQVDLSLNDRPREVSQAEIVVSTVRTQGDERSFHV